MQNCFAAQRIESIDYQYEWIIDSTVFIRFPGKTFLLMLSVDKKHFYSTAQNAEPYPEQMSRKTFPVFTPSIYMKQRTKCLRLLNSDPHKMV